MPYLSKGSSVRQTHALIDIHLPSKAQNSTFMKARKIRFQIVKLRKDLAHIRHNITDFQNLIQSEFPKVLTTVAEFTAKAAEIEVENKRLNHEYRFYNNFIV